MQRIIDNYQEIRNQAEARVAAARPADRIRIFIGLGTCSIAVGAREVLTAIEDELKDSQIPAEVVQVGCIGACFAEPLVTIAKPGRPPIAYARCTTEIATTLIDDYVVGDDPRPDLAFYQMLDAQNSVPGIPSWKELSFFKGQERIVLARCGFIDPESIEEYIAQEGYKALAHALAEMRPSEVIEEIKGSGLRGRGGAGFPAGLKWEFAAKAADEVKYIICNGDESEPGTFKDRLIMEGDPHLLIEGMAIAGYAVGAKQGYIYIRGEYPLAAERVGKAIAQARALGLLGESILGSDFAFDIKVHQGAGAYVCGEETALIESMEGKRGMPRIRPPFPPSYGLWGKPTVVNNVETLANIAPIIANGAVWFKGFGTERSPGTKVHTILGDIHHRGAIEVPLGLTVREAIEVYGGGMLEGGFKLAQTGGSAGTIVPASKLDVPLDYDSMSAAGVSIGSGALLIGSETNRAVDLLKTVMRFFAIETCGKCVPCREGTVRAYEILSRLSSHGGKEGDIALLEGLAQVLRLASFCGLGLAAAVPLASALGHFREELEACLGEGHIGSAAVPSRPKAAEVGRLVEVASSVQEILARHAPHAEALVGVLREVDASYDYIPTSAMDEIAAALRLPPSHIYGTTTFYSLLSTASRGEYVIRYCQDAPCHVMGAAEILDTLRETLGVEPGETTPDGKFTLEAVSCLGICGVGPVLMIDNLVYGNLTPERVQELLAKVGGE